MQPIRGKGRGMSRGPNNLKTHEEQGPTKSKVHMQPIKGRGRGRGMLRGPNNLKAHEEQGPTKSKVPMQPIRGGGCRGAQITSKPMKSRGPTKRYPCSLLGGGG